MQVLPQILFRTIATTLLAEEWVNHHHLELLALFFYPASTPHRLHCLLKWFVTSKGNERMRISDTGDRGSQAVRSLQDKNLLLLFALVYELILHQIALVPTYSHYKNQQKDAPT